MVKEVNTLWRDEAVLFTTARCSSVIQIILFEDFIELGGLSGQGNWDLDLGLLDNK